MKSLVLIIVLLVCATTIFANEKQADLLIADKDWYIEDFNFPINFAREIKITGDINLRFPPGWSKKDNPNFWSYVWAWKIKDSDGLNEQELKNNVELYFDGLLGLNSETFINKEFPKQKTIATFTLTKATADTSKYTGEVKTIDTRYTKKPMILFVQVEQYLCKKENKSILLFRYSPRTFEDLVWRTLSSVKLVSTQC